MNGTALHASEPFLDFVHEKGVKTLSSRIPKFGAVSCATLLIQREPINHATGVIVTPANPGSVSGAGAGVQESFAERGTESRETRDWIPASAGMTVVAPKYVTELRHPST